MNAGGKTYQRVQKRMIFYTFWYFWIIFSIHQEMLPRNHDAINIYGIILIKLSRSVLRLSICKTRLFSCTEGTCTEKTQSLKKWWCFMYNYACEDRPQGCRYHRPTLWYSSESCMCSIDWPQLWDSKTHNPKFWLFWCFLMQETDKLAKIG